MPLIEKIKLLISREHPRIKVNKILFCCSTVSEGAHEQNVFLLRMLSFEIIFS